MDRSLNLLVGGLALIGGGACSDPASLPAQAGMAIEIFGGSSCLIGASPPFAIPTGSYPILMANCDSNSGCGGGDDARVVDGDPDTDVSCTVSANDNLVSVSGSLGKASVVSFSVSGEFPPTGCPRATAGAIENKCARVAQRNNQSQAQLEGDCYLDVEFVKGGAIYAKFDCDALTEDATSCPARGAFVFENCRK
jgi:hypothetical protein